MFKKGITIAGTTILDCVKNINQYPDIGMLVNIDEVKYAVGGCVPNVGINLAKIDGDIPISAIAKVGNDENGKYIISELEKYNIDTSGISYAKTNATSFCDVMSVPSGERTFFLKKGANVEFSPDDIDISSLDCDILHIGYILLLDEFDKPHSEYGTVMAEFLSKVQKKGIKTSIDTVSQAGANYGAKIIPALKYCDYVIINEIEICGIWGINPRKDNGCIDEASIFDAMKKTMSEGVKEKVIVHCKEMAFSLDTLGNFTKVPSLKIPSKDIKGTVGAGDAFCAGCLYGIYNNYSDKEILEFASGAAACNLLEANSVDGMKPKKEILNFAEKCGRLNI